MEIQKELLIKTVCAVMSIAMVGTAQANKSVFVISKHGNPSKAEALSIDSNQVHYQGTIDISTLSPGFGAVGNAVWPEKELMFVTFESSNVIVWASTKTLQKVGEFATGATDLAGIAVDKNKEKIYVAKRGYNDLYVYSFDEPNNTLILDGHYDLGVPSGWLYGWGLALDEENDLLYISTNSKTVHVYDTSDWSHDHSIDISVSGTDRAAVGIAVDPIRGYLYTGHWTLHNYLARTDTVSPYTSTEVEITREGYSSRQLIGVDVDDDTGLVYITTYHDDFRVYDSNLVLQDTERNDDISGPAGVAVGGWYKKPVFSLSKDNNDVNDDCVFPFNPIDENYLVFDICWDANGYADTNATVTDYLPAELDYYSSVPAGDYNSAQRSVTWDLGAISGSESNCFVLTTKVNEWARPGGVITNNARIEGDEYLSWDVTDTNICAWGAEIIYVDKDANGYNNGTNWDDAYTNLQDGLTGARKCGAAVTAVWVAAGTYKPIWDANDMTMNETFELIEDVGLFGHFGGIGTYETSTSQRNFADANNETILGGQIGDNYYDAVKYIVTAEDIEDAVLDGFTIKGSYSGAGVFLDNADVAIVNCKLKNNRNYGIDVTSYSSPDIHNCTFIDNSSQGVRVYNHCWPEVSNCIFDGNDSTSYGIYMGSYSVMVVSDCVSRKHTNYGIDGDNGTLTVNNSTFDDNPYGLSLSDVATTMTDCSVKNSDFGVYASGCGTLTINNCSIKNSNYTGIDIYNCDLTIDHSVIAHSADNGLYTSSGCNLILKNSAVRYSGEEGIELHDNLVTTIKNNWIHNNGTDHISSRASGISFNNQSSVPLVRNNTIYDNWTYGLQSSEQGADPNVINCIIYGNDSNDFYRENGTFDTVNYCNLQNSHSGTGNITGDPGFRNVATDPNDLHLDETSQCKDAGDPNGSYADETDIDGEDRIQYGRVDIGGDEYYWSSADFDEDGTVNFIDYAIFAAAW